MQISLKIFILTLIFAIPVGIIVSVLSMSKHRLVKVITKIYILIMRGTPLLLQIICIYFAPYYLFKISCNRFIAIIIAFSLNYAAYFGEIFRSGIESISKGQWEAAYTLGFNKVKTFFIIVLPQATKNVIPAIGNEMIALLKETAILGWVGATPGTLTFDLNAAANTIYHLVPNYLASGLIVSVCYLVIVNLMILLVNYIERRLRANDKR